MLEHVTRLGLMQSEVTDPQPLPRADQEVSENVGMAYHSDSNCSGCT